MRMPRGYWKRSAKELAIAHPITCGAPSTGYIQVSIDGVRRQLHRYVWEELVGPIPENYEVDHKNGIKTDCRISNLRCVTKKVNARNRGKQPNNTSGTTGVSRVVIKGMEYWKVTWSHPVSLGKKIKYFSVKKLGEEEAKTAAHTFREQLMRELIDEYNYTERHGK